MAQKQISPETLDAVAADATLVAQEGAQPAVSLSEDVAARVLADTAEDAAFVEMSADEICAEIGDLDLD